MSLITKDEEEGVDRDGRFNDGGIAVTSVEEGAETDEEGEEDVTIGEAMGVVIGEVDGSNRGFVSLITVHHLSRSLQRVITKVAVEKSCTLTEG